MGYSYSKETMGYHWATTVGYSSETPESTLGCYPEMLGYNWATLEYSSEMSVSPEIVELVPDDFEFLGFFEQSN